MQPSYMCALKPVRSLCSLFGAPQSNEVYSNQMSSTFLDWAIVAFPAFPTFPAHGFHYRLVVYFMSEYYLLPLEVLQWARPTCCLRDSWTCTRAVLGGNLQVLQCGPAPMDALFWDSESHYMLRGSGKADHLEVLQCGPTSTDTQRTRTAPN